MLQALLELRPQVRPNDKGEGDPTLLVSVYRRKLMERYPVHAILAVLKAYPDDHDFWPTWHQLRVEMDAHMAHQELMARPRLAAPPPAADATPVMDPRTPKERLADHDLAMAALRDGPFIGPESVRQILLRIGEGVRTKIVNETQETTHDV